MIAMNDYDYVCEECGQAYSSYNSLYKHKRRHIDPNYNRPKPKTVIVETTRTPEPEQFTNEQYEEKPTSPTDHSKAARNVMLFAVGCIVVFVFFRKNIVEFLGLDDNDDSGMVYNVNGGNIL